MVDGRFGIIGAAVRASDGRHSFAGSTDGRRHHGEHLERLAGRPTSVALDHSAPTYLMLRPAVSRPTWYTPLWGPTGRLGPPARPTTKNRNSPGVVTGPSRAREQPRYKLLA